MLTLSLGIAAVVVGIIIILSIFLIRGLRRNFILHMFAKFSKNKTENSQNMEAFIKNFGSLATKRYNYSDVKKMTESFSNKLGQGGYGDVYKGKLPDNRLVAVKFLKESKGNGEEFTNELLWWLPFVFLQCFTSVVILNIRPSLAIIGSDAERDGNGSGSDVKLASLFAPSLSEVVVLSLVGSGVWYSISYCDFGDLLPFNGSFVHRISGLGLEEASPKFLG
ncbi:hypothetical protein QYF36_025890 [Acer negundo]|nr:hypothetical protein QYF36_025890 [Acer negundo]